MAENCNSSIARDNSSTQPDDIRGETYAKPTKRSGYRATKRAVKSLLETLSE